MRKMLERIKNSKGYVSIETIIVAGLVIGLGVFTVSAFQNEGNQVSGNAMKKIQTANGGYNVVAPTVAK